MDVAAVEQKHMDDLLRYVENLGLGDTRHLLSSIRKHTDNYSYTDASPHLLVPQYGLTVGEVALAFVLNTKR